ncbi:hypothetical protein LguiB_032203 [Lonicera macranthoides]
MSKVPNDVLADILSRLPVKLLLRFSCISKQWRALIGSDDFIKLHLTRSIETNTNRIIVIKDDDCLYSVNLDSLDNAVRLNPPLNLNKQCVYGTTIIGSCNGLLCLTNTEKYIFLWNPTTSKYWKSAVCRIPLGVENVVFGFGYDDAKDDYKVVRLVQFFGKDKESFRSEVSVYSLKSDSWRRIGDFPYYLSYGKVSGVLASGALHWAVSRKRRWLDLPRGDLIAAFDLRSEEYRLVPQPEYSMKNFDMKVDVLEGCLCVLCKDYLLQFEMWVMEDYGVEKSWTKLISCVDPNVYWFHDIVLPVAYSKSRKQMLLLQDYRKFIWYDITTERDVKVEIDGMPNRFDSRVCLGSLIQPTGAVESAGGSGRTLKKKRQFPVKGIQASLSSFKQL